jgi:hypothetical protein
MTSITSNDPLFLSTGFNALSDARLGMDLSPPQLSLDDLARENQTETFALSLTQLGEYGERVKEKHQAKEALSQALQTAINERAQKAMTSNGWSTLLKIASSLTALLSIAVGTAAVASGAALPVGIAMIAAGGLTLSLQVASEFDLMNKVANYLSRGDAKLKTQIEWHLNFWSSITSLLLSFATMGFGGANIVSQVLGRSGQILQSGLLTMNAFTTLGKGVTEKYRFDSEAKVKELQNEDEILTKEIEHIRTLLQESIDRRKKEIKLTIEILESTNEAQLKIIRLNNNQ